MKKRATKIVDAKSIAAAGETVTAEFPSDFTVTHVAFTQQGANVSDEATLAELLAGLGTIEISTRHGIPTNWDADDLYYFNRDYFGQSPYVSKTTGSGSDNDIRRITLIVPVNPMGPWDSRFGITPESKAKTRVVMGSDTGSGMDARTLTVTCLGIEGINPQSFMGAYLDSFTAVVGDNFRDIQTDRVLGMMGAYLFATTSPEDLTSTDALGCRHMGWGISKSLKEKIHAHVLQQYARGIDPTAGSDTPSATEYSLLDTGLGEGSYLPFVDNFQAFVDAGVAEAMRLYPLLAIRNT